MLRQGLNWILKGVLLYAHVLYAADTVSVPTTFLPPSPALQHINWVFSGLVANENGEKYAYFFQMQREGNELHSLAALFDGQSKQLIFMDENKATMHQQEPYHYDVDRAFLRFNPINGSWIFGLKTKDKQGFNFKVDMLRHENNTPAVQELHQGVELLVNQNNRLNGHLQVGTLKEEFVTAKNTWFRQVWLTHTDSHPYPFMGTLCQFNDGSGFYSLTMKASDTLSGAVAGWSDTEGMPGPISQFIDVKEDEKGHWHIYLTSPLLHVVLADFIKQASIVAGFMVEEKQTGFCMLTKEVLDSTTSPQT